VVVGALPEAAVVAVATVVSPATVVWSDTVVGDAPAVVVEVAGALACFAELPQAVRDASDAESTTTRTFAWLMVDFMRIFQVMKLSVLKDRAESFLRVSLVCSALLIRCRRYADDVRRRSAMR
jgi:hypothetical protein